METSRRWIRTTALGLAFALAGGVATPLLAAENKALRPIAAAVAEKVAQADVKVAVAQQTAATAAPMSEQKSFFRSRKGLLTIALLAGGLGYAVYSAKNEAIKSPIR